MKILVWIITTLVIFPVIGIGLMIPILNIFIMKELGELFYE